MIGDVEPGQLELPSEAQWYLSAPAQRLVAPVASEHLGDRELGGVGTGDEVFDRDDLGHSGSG